MTSKTSQDGALYYVGVLHTVYLQVSDKKGIRSLFDPSTGHRLNLNQGIWICDWAKGLPTKEDLALQDMISPQMDLSKCQSKLEEFALFMGRYDRWKKLKVSQ